MSTVERKTLQLTERVLGIEASPTLVVASRAAEMKRNGIDVIDFGPGEPDFPTPANVAEAAKQAIDDGFTRYTNALGCNELREAIAERYNQRYGTRLRLQNVIAGSGGKQELFNLMMALVSDGDEVIIPVPYWVSFPAQVAFAGGRPVFVETDDAFRPTLASIESATTERTRGVILNSPSNPSGAVIEESELEAIIRFCAARDLFLVFDETYEFFVYGKKHASALRWIEEFPETVIVVNSMSKTYAMTGWRLGFAIAHPELISALGKIQSHSTSNPTSIAQMAAVAALQGGEEEIERMLAAYAERRAWLIPALNEIPGVECHPPDGAFYVFPRVSGTYGRNGIDSSTAFAEYLLQEAHVAVVPGEAFGMDDCVRISYAASMDALREGASRMKSALERLIG